MYFAPNNAHYQIFVEIVAELRYGTIGVNAWSGVEFLMPACTWGAFPGHALDDVQSGIGTVHNAFMFDKAERTVVQAPWRPFPRDIASGGLTILPKPPWFVNNKKQHKIGKLLTLFQYKPSWAKLPRIFLNALLGLRPHNSNCVIFWTIWFKYMLEEKLEIFNMEHLMHKYLIKAL